MTQDADAQVLTSIGEHYVVDRVIGRGGMATVYLCRDTRDNSRVAVKVLRKELGSAIIVERFLREISFASELDHPRIPKVLDSGVIDGLPYYAMTYVEGESLKHKLEREKQLRLDDAIGIACQVIAPTAYAHSRGIVHRDIKPDNILIAPDGVYVLDFGIARAIVESGVDRLTSTGVGVGTPAYMSPEQALGDRNLDARSDVYSLGCVVYEMIAGIPPFVGPTSQAIISRRFAAPPPPLSHVRDSVPEEVEDAVQRALARSPADRWSTVAEFGAALEACTTDTVDGAATRRRSRRKRLPAVSVTIGLALLIVTVLGWSAARREPLASAERAIRGWDLERAEAQVRRAVRLRPEDPRAQIWLAQLLMLRGAPTSEWKSAALFAHDRRAELTESDQRRAVGLNALASDDFAIACARFNELARDDARPVADFIAALSLGDCLREDPTVLPDSTSPSRYRFRTSYHQADSIYRSILERSPNTPAAYAAILPRLELVRPVYKATFRRGTLPKSSGPPFSATPLIIADTLASIPYPRIGAAWATRDERALDIVVARNRALLRSMAVDWVRVEPQGSRAHAFLAKILESTAELEGGEVSALQQIRIARQLPHSSSDPGENYLSRLRLSADEVEVLVRLGYYTQAGLIADSALAAPAPRSLSEAVMDQRADILSSLAAIRGRPSTVVRLAQRFATREQVRLPNGEIVTLTPVLGRDELALMGYSAFGAPADSIYAVMGRLSENLEALVSASQLAAWRFAVFTRPLVLAAPTIGAAPLAALPPNPEISVLTLQTFGKGDLRKTRVLLDSMTRLRADLAPGEITIDAVYVGAWLRSALGDSAGAVRDLDRGFRGLETALPRVLKDDIQAASLVRAMMLRAELARGKEPAVAARWSKAAFELWGTGDPAIVTAVRRATRVE